MPKTSKTKKATGASTSSTSSAPSKEHQDTHVNWPALEPVIPPELLSIETVLPKQIFTISQFFTANLCKTYVNYLSKLPLVTTPKQPKRGEAVRVNDRFQIQDPKFAKSLWLDTGLKDVIEREEYRNVIWKDAEVEGNVKAWGLNPNIRIYRYTPYQHFAKHFDDTNTISCGTPPADRKTIYTLLVYLTGQGEVTGGETAFYPQEPYIPLTKKQLRELSGTVPQVIKVAPERGMALLHRHGDECLLHEGMEVREGVKWIIRSDLVLEN